MVKFIVITSQRTGSTYISNYLHNHPEIAMYEEIILNKLETPGGLKHFVENKKIMNFLFGLYNVKLVRKTHAKIPFYLPINLIVKRFLEVFFTRDKNFINDNNVFNNSTNKLLNEPKAIGFKVMVNHMNSIPYIRKWILQNNVKIIILKRENILKKYVSHVASYKRKIAHSTKNVENVNISLDIPDCERYIRNTMNEYKILDSFKKDKNCFSLSYEEFFSDPEKNMKEVLSFIGVNEKIPFEKPKLKKLNSKSLEDIVQNLDEVKLSLENNNFDKYI